MIMSKEIFDCTVNEFNDVVKALNEVDPEYSGEDQKIKDSGNRREFESGAVRDIQEGKGENNWIF